jgi:hypothetical protein
MTYNMVYYNEPAHMQGNNEGILGGYQGVQNIGTGYQGAQNNIGSGYQGAQNNIGVGYQGAQNNMNHRYATPQLQQLQQTLRNRFNPMNRNQNQNQNQTPNAQINQIANRTNNCDTRDFRGRDVQLGNFIRELNNLYYNQQKSRYVNKFNRISELVTTFSFLLKNRFGWSLNRDWNNGRHRSVRRRGHKKRFRYAEKSTYRSRSHDSNTSCNSSSKNSCSSSDSSSNSESKSKKCGSKPKSCEKSNKRHNRARSC